jgi:hypothetical protein
MKKFKLTLLMALAMIFLVADAHAVMQHFQATVYKRDNTKYGMQGEASANVIAATGITYKVLQYNSNTAETILSGSGWGTATTSKTNPVTSTVYATDGGRIDFYCDPAETANTYVDLIVVDKTGGYTASVKGFTKNMHQVVIDETPNVMHHGLIWFESGATSNTETSTGVSFVYDTFLHDVRPEVVTTVSGKLLSVGLLSTETSGSATGLRTGVLLTTAGYVNDTGVVTRGTSTDYTAVTTYGTMLYTAVTGLDSTTGGNAHVGGRSYLGYAIQYNKAHTLVFTADTSTSAGYIHYWFTKMR